MILGQPIKIKPALNAHIRKEDGNLLAHDGETVIASSYWARRLLADDIAEIPAEVATSAPKSKD